MLISRKALQSFVDFDLDARQLAEELSHIGFPNDAIHRRGEGLGEVVVAKILEKKQHPNADRLSLLKVDNGSENLQIVCGAQNMKQGDLVALAPVGATIPGVDGQGMKLKKSKIRGESSEGMCCSEVELGLAEESDGIWILPPKVAENKLGHKISDVFNLEDDVIEVDITPNRGDALCVKGLARELAAKWGKKLRPAPTQRWKSISSMVNPSIEDFEDAYGFAACLVRGVRVEETPEEWKQFLMAHGGRSISNLVDITNIVLFEQGHPIHFFDADRVDPQSIGVRRARAGEKLKLLNEQEIELSPEDLVIADKNSALSLAGVMGGSESSVGPETQNILIEVASFNPQRIRATAQRHGLSSESSFRFERGVTAFRLDEVVERALGLLHKLSGYKLAEGSKVVAPKLERRSCSWSRERVESKLGALPETDNDLFDRLRLLEYEFEPGGGHPQVIFPSYRTDVEILEDAMEDIARLKGYENLQKKTLVMEESVKVLPDLREETSVANQLANRLVEKGFVEVLHWSFSNPEQEQSLGLETDQQVKIANPIHSKKSVLRTSLLPNLLERAKFNFDRGEDEIRIFEMGPVFSLEGQSDYENSAVNEIWKCGLLLCERQNASKFLWQADVDSYFYFKGVLEAVLSDYKVSAHPEATSFGYFHPNRQGYIKAASFGELHPSVLTQWGLNGRYFYAEIPLHALQQTPKEYHRPPSFPGIELDLSLEVDRTITMKDLMEAFDDIKTKKLVRVRPYDVYEPKELKVKGRRSITFALRYQDHSKTMEMEEATKLKEKLLEGLIERFSAEKVALR